MGRGVWAEVVGSAQMIERKVGKRKGKETEERNRGFGRFWPNKIF